MDISRACQHTMAIFVGVSSHFSLIACQHTMAIFVGVFSHFSLIACQHTMAIFVGVSSNFSLIAWIKHGKHNGITSYVCFNVC
jgi:hypothetical protein